MFKGANRMQVTPLTIMEAVEAVFNSRAYNSMQIKVTGISSLTSGMYEIAFEPRSTQPTAKDKAIAEAAEDKANYGARRKQ